MPGNFSYSDDLEITRLIGTSTVGAKILITRANAIIWVSENGINTNANDNWVSKDEAFTDPCLIHIQREGLPIRRQVRGAETYNQPRSYGDISFYIRPASEQGASWRYTIMQWD